MNVSSSEHWHSLLLQGKTILHTVLHMALWQHLLLLLCCIQNCMEASALTPAHQRNNFNNCFRLTRSTRTRVQQLLNKYKEQHLGNRDFEDRSQHLKDLPLLSTDFFNWLRLTDWERLHAAFLDMQSYWNMLEWKRKELEEEEKNQRVVQVTKTTLLQSIRHIQLDLRDLMSQVNSQMSYMNSSWIRPTSTTAQMPLNPVSSTKTVWDSRVEGYIILRDLDLYLTKLARDFLLLALKIHL